MDRFIVGTGRCGSTLLSRMLGEHRGTLSIFEFFNGLPMARRFATEPVSGEELAALVSQEHPFVTMVLSRGYEVPEITYPFGPGARYTREEGLPWILVAALPRLSDSPDTLFDETLAFARGLPDQPLDRHYRRLFDWLAQRLGRTQWIERSGSSIDYLDSLRSFFPEARFLHIHRDGPEAALSMREHHAYRLAVTFLYRVPTRSGRSIADLATADPRGRPGAADPIAEILESRPPVELFGRYWTQQLAHGFRALARLDADQYMEVAFEDLVREPRAVLRRIDGFFELGPDGGDGDWVERAAALVRGVPPTRFEKLAEDEQQRLAEACRTGRELLGRRP